MIRAWWNSLPPREQRMVAVGAVVVAVMLGWALVWHPLAMKRAELREAIDAQRRDLAYVRVASAEVDRLRTVSKHSGGDRQGRSLLALADASARTGGLEGALRRVEPMSASSVRVTFEFARFDALIGWIEGLTRDYGIEAVDFSADRADGVGLVNARVTLQDAP
ncbi:MAG TPA: type II secretion system protein M [Rhodanobacteraceae bacterium]|nr:type II secretion system protein M [Rhodanobacteraceae bacterium]